MLLTDVRLVENLQVINESSGGKPMKVRGIFQRADEANNNGRIYPQQVLENAINNLIEAVQERRCVGELDHPTYDMVKLSNASHIITSLRFEGKDVIGEAEILSTPAGKVVEALIKDGIKIGISSRGMGTLSEGKGHKIVNEDFKLLTFDIVADPSTRGAFPTLAESKNYNSKAVEKTIKKVVGRNVFLSILEAKIDNKLDELRVDEKGRCWKNHEPTPGVKPFAKGSCRPISKNRKDEANLLDKDKSPKEKAEARTKRAKESNPAYSYLSNAEANNARATDHYIRNITDRYNKERGKPSPRAVRKDRRNAYQTRGTRNRYKRQDSSNVYEKYGIAFLSEMMMPKKEGKPLPKHVISEKPKGTGPVSKYPEPKKPIPKPNSKGGKYEQ